MRILLLAVVPSLLLGCAKTEPAPEPVRAVRTLTVTAQTAGGTQEYAGEVRARVESRLSFRVDGKMVRRSADLGDTVKAGQVLAQRDPQDFRLGKNAPWRRPPRPRPTTTRRRPNIGATRTCATRASSVRPISSAAT